MDQRKSLRHVFGAGLLISGTAVGAGMLALPIITGVVGFFPSFLVYLFSWVVMTTTGLLYLEVCLLMPKNSNIISLAHHYLGSKGRIFAWIVYLFLFYSLSVAYISGGSEFFSIATKNLFSQQTGVIIFVVLFGFFVYLGAQMVDRFNLILMVGLIISYLALISLGIGSVKFSLLSHTKWSHIFFTFPVVLISFGFQGIVPSITTYLQKEGKKVRLAIILGTSFALIIYLIFEYLILGIVPVGGENGLIEAKIKGMNAIDPLRKMIQEKRIYAIGQFFSFFAITTSFLGVSLGLFDFLSDGLNLKKKGTKKIVIALITFIPSTFIVLINPKVFLIALNYAGGIGGSLLLILLPVLLVWSSRYYNKKDITRSFQVPGGKTVLILLFLFACFEIIISIYQEIIRLF